MSQLPEPIKNQSSQEASLQQPVDIYKWGKADIRTEQTLTWTKVVKKKKSSLGLACC